MNAKPKKEFIDIYGTELERKLPHWLHPSQRDPQAANAIRKRNRAKWLAQQKRKSKAK